MLKKVIFLQGAFDGNTWGSRSKCLTGSPINNIARWYSRLRMKVKCIPKLDLITSLAC